MSDTLPSVPLSRDNSRRDRAFHFSPHALIGVSAIIAAWFHQAASHKRDLQTEQYHANSLASLIHADPRFQRIQVLTFTGRDGCLHVSGDVASRDDAEVLRILVASTKPPVKTQFMVSIHVNGSDQFEAVSMFDLPAYHS